MVEVELSDGEKVEIPEERKRTVRKKKQTEKKEEEKQKADSDGEKSDEDEDSKNKNNSADDEATKNAKEHLEEMEKNEMKLIFKIYAETFIRRILRLIEIFTSVSQTSAHPLSMVSKVASPYMLYSLINILLVSSPRTKLLSLKIIQNLMNIGIPAPVFESTVNIMAQSKNSLGYKIINSVESTIKFEDSGFLNFFFKYLLHIRQSMFSKLEIQS